MNLRRPRMTDSRIGAALYKFSYKLDPVLLGIAFMFTILGLFVLYSASETNITRPLAQLMNYILAFTCLWCTTYLPPNLLKRFAIPLYLLGIVLLIGVYFFGDVSKGARRWLNIGVMRIQPSEIMKIALPLSLAWLFDHQQNEINFKTFTLAIIMMLVPGLLILKQPDLGTTILVFSSGFYILFFAGLPWKIISAVIATIGAAAPFLWHTLHDYQRKRIMVLLDPSEDPLGAGYHIIQANIALGSGGTVGKGWLNGSQTHLDFLPEKHTDFIFAVFGEEFGLIGAIVLVLLYFALISRGLFIARYASSLFERLLASAITLSFFTYAIVNMGMVSGILPVVGVPLPFISYGGTALVTLFLGIGILMSIHANKKLMANT
ncbi:MAG: rod shape-determining protein RodA [Pseudomonadota bacterium]